jgi:predicted ATPase/transcriptional regulator with XRE-family HTH domain
MAASPSDFANTIRSFRLRAGLSQEELAERAGVSARAVSDMERGLRKSPRPETLRLLAEALALDADERSQFFVAAHSEPEGIARTSPRDTTGRSGKSTANLLASRPLPRPLDALIGREHDVEAIVSLLESDQARLITLTGPGGVGKTRLALALASRIAGEFPDGVVFVELGPLTDAGQVLPAIAGSVGLRDVGDRPLLDVLTGVLTGRRILLVLDNFEHVMPAASAVAALVRECPHLRVVVTSREPLRVRGERETPVAPLPVPRTDREATLEDLQANPSVALFASRAAEVRPDFTLTDTNAAQIVEVCRQLDGLPLAIELAAARVRLLSPAALLERLEQRLGLLTEGARDAPDRQQTLRATIAWSYDLLSPTEQIFFRRMSVFVNGFTLEGAAAVAGMSVSDVFDIVTSLVEKNLLNASQTPEGETRFWMLESMRAFGFDRLEAHGEVAVARQAHLEYVLAMTGALADDGLALWWLAEHWIEQIDTELGNIRSAMAWAKLRDDGESLLRIATVIGGYWIDRPYPDEAISLFEAGLSNAPSASARVQVAGWFYAGILAGSSGDHQAAMEYAEAARSIAATSREPDLLAIVDCLMGLLWEMADDCKRSAQSYRAAIAAFDGAEGVYWYYMALAELGDRLLVCGDPEEAEPLLARAEAGYRAIGSRSSVAMVIGQRAHADIARGRLDAARGLFKESIDESRMVSDLRVELGAVMGLAAIAFASGEAAQAARMIGLAQREREVHGIGRKLCHQLENERTIALVREALGGEIYRQCVQEGEALSYTQFLSEALPEL